MTRGLIFILKNFQLHGSYSKDDDEFRTHRVTQAFQLSQFINMTRGNCDVIILGGDLNVEPTDLEYRIITTNSGLSDAWVSQVGGSS